MEKYNSWSAGKMKNFIRIFLFVLGITLLQTLYVNAQEAFTLYYNAKNLMHQREYDEALKLFNLLKLQHPDSKFIDDVDFWSAYINEQQGKTLKAFNAYGDVIKKHPESPWADDATLYQISAAEKLASQGEKKYLNFLLDNLSSDNKNIKYQSSISLGNLRDKRSIPVLTEMANNGDKDMSLVAKSLLKSFDRIYDKKGIILKNYPVGKSQPVDDDVKKRTIKQPSNISSPGRNTPAVTPNKTIQHPTPAPARQNPPSSGKKKETKF